MLGLAPAASTSSVSRSTACLLLCKGPPCSSPKTAPCQLPCAAAHRSADVHLVRLPCPAVCVCCGQAKRRKLEGLLESICGVITADDLMCTAAPGGQPPPRHLEPYLCPPTAFAFALPLPLPFPVPSSNNPSKPACRCAECVAHSRSDAAEFRKQLGIAQAAGNPQGLVPQGPPAEGLGGNFGPAEGAEASGGRAVGGG